MATIKLRFPAVCADCGADLEVGEIARYYGRGVTYGTSCHPQIEGDRSARETVSEIAAVAEDIAEHVARKPKRTRKAKPKQEPEPVDLGPGCFDKAELKRALGHVIKGVSTRPGIPALTGVLIETGHDYSATLTTTDLEVTVRATVRYGAGELRALIPARLLAEALKGRARKGETVKVTTDEAMATVGDRLTIRLLPSEDFPKLADTDELTGFDLDGGTFPEHVRAVTLAASRDEARPILTGVRFESTGRTGKHEGPLMAATDSYRLHVVELAADPKLAAFGALVPERAVTLAGKVAKAEKVERVSFFHDGEKGARVRFIVGSVEIVSRQIEGEFPNWRQLIPEAYQAPGGVLTYGPELMETVREAGLMARDNAPVHLGINPLGVRVSASSPDLGEYVEGVEAEWTGTELAVAFNPDYLIGAMEATSCGPLHVRDGLKPGMLYGETVTALVMPVRVPAPVEVDKGEAETA